MKKVLLTICLANLFLFSTTLFAQQLNSVEGDHQAIMDLFVQSNGAGWWNNSGWENSTPETMGEMYGITVWESGVNAGRVKEIDLFQNNLVGTLPSSIGNLTKCEILKLKQPLNDEEWAQNTPPDKLYGEIPSSIGNMISLKWLSLSGQYDDILLVPYKSWNEENHGANITGAGKTFSNGNYFTGQIPPEIGNLVNLEMLEIRRHGFTGALPAEIGNLNSLIGLFINGKHDDTDSNEPALTGQIPPELGNLTNLIHLHLNRNNFTGVIPSEFNNLIDLRHFRVGRNSYDPHELPIFDGFQNMRIFKVQNSNLIGRFPIELFEGGRNPNLHNFGIHSNNISGELPKELDVSYYTNLVIFSISINEMTGSIPNWVTELELIHFNFTHNNFTGDLPEGFHNSDSKLYNKLRNLRLNSNQLSGPMPNANLGPAIYVIALGSNEFSGSIPEVWSETTSTRPVKITVDQNNLSGPIPVELLNIENLSEIDISDNKFSNSDIQPILDIMDASIEFNYSNQNPLEDDGGTNEDPPATPEVPSLNSPADNAGQVSVNASFSWTAVEAETFRLQVENTGTSKIVIDIETDKTSYTTPSALLYETTYSWKVKAVSESVESDWSTARTFETEIEEEGNPDEGGDGNDDLLPAPILSTPTNESENIPLRPSFEWSDVDADYYILHSNRVDPGEMVIETEVQSSSYIPDFDLEPETTYHWRVRGVKDGVEGKWSPISSFTTGSEDPELAVEAELDQNYPNPFNPSTQIRFTIGKSQQVSLKVYDMSGRLVANLVDNTSYSAGSHEVTFNANSLASGIYFYRFITESEIVTRKMTLMK